MMLCFGLKLDAAEWAKALGIEYEANCARECGFCLKSNPRENNFCGNCGADLRKKLDYNPTDLTEITLLKFGKAPRPIEVFPGKDCIYIAQILADGQHFVPFEKPADRFPWTAISKAISDYVGIHVESTITPYLFALNGEEKNEK